MSALSLSTGFATGSALLGGLLAVAARRRERLLGLARTFAFASAVGVVGVHLLPEAVHALGAWALLWALAGFAAPALIELSADRFGPQLARRAGHAGLRAAAEIGFAALFFHSVVEGLTLEASARSGQALDVQLALVAHHAPLTAAVTLPFLELGSARRAVNRVLLVAVAGACGTFLAGALPGLSGGSASFLAAAGAATAGALFHVAADEVRAQRAASVPQRLLDLGAFAAGLGVAFLGSALSPEGGRGLAQLWLAQTLQLASAVGPALTLGLLAVAAASWRGVAGRLAPLVPPVAAAWALGGAHVVCLALGSTLLGATAWPRRPGRSPWRALDWAAALFALLAVAGLAGAVLDGSSPASVPGWLLLAGLAAASLRSRSALDGAQPAPPARGPRELWAATAGTILLALFFVWPGAAPRSALFEAALGTPPAVQLLRAAALLALFVAGLFQRGPRGFFAPLRPGSEADGLLQHDAGDAADRQHQRRVDLEA